MGIDEPRRDHQPFSVDDLSAIEAYDLAYLDNTLTFDGYRPFEYRATGAVDDQTVVDQQGWPHFTLVICLHVICLLSLCVPRLSDKAINQGIKPTLSISRQRRLILSMSVSS